MPKDHGKSSQNDTKEGRRSKKCSTSCYIGDVLVKETVVSIVAVGGYGSPEKKFGLTARVIESRAALEFRLEKDRVGNLGFWSVCVLYIWPVNKR